MKYSALTLCFLIAFSFGSLAQQDIQLSNFELYSTSFNPATLTNTNYICGSLSIRNQWSGFNGHPRTAHLSARGNYKNLIWGGLNILSDQLGQQQSTHLILSLAKRWLLTPSTYLSLGGNFHFHQMNIGNAFVTPDTPYYLDNSIPNASTKDNNADGDFGVFIKHKEVYAGLSVTQLFATDFSASNFHFNSARHYYVYAGFNHPIHFGTFENRILAKSDAASTQLDFKTNFWHSSGWMLGIGYRVSDAIIPIIGYEYDATKFALRLIYSYDITVSKLKSYSSGSHEIGLNLCLKKPNFPNRYTHPRHLGTWKY